MIVSNRLRIVAAGITAMLAVSLAGCGGSDDSDKTAAPAAGTTNTSRPQQNRKAPIKAPGAGTLQPQ